MESKITFYYFYWQHSNHIRFENQVLLLSIILLQKVYPECIINIVFYTKIPDSFEIFANIKNLNFIEYQNYYIKKQQKIKNLLKIQKDNNLDSPYLLSKPIDCFNIAKKNEENVIILDLDFFVFKKFENLNFNKVGFWFWNQTKTAGVNTGLIAFGTKSFEPFYFFDIYEKMLNLFDNEYLDIKKALINQVYGVPEASLQEEIIFSLIKQKYFELNNLIFYDIRTNNHQLYLKNLHTEYSRNIHTASLNKNRICPVLCKSNYIKNVIAEYENGIFLQIFKDYIENNELSEEETRLLNNINDCLPKITKIKFL